MKTLLLNPSEKKAIDTILLKLAEVNNISDVEAVNINLTGAEGVIQFKQAFGPAIPIIMSLLPAAYTMISNMLSDPTVNEILDKLIDQEINKPDSGLVAQDKPKYKQMLLDIVKDGGNKVIEEAKADEAQKKQQGQQTTGDFSAPGKGETIQPEQTWENSPENRGYIGSLKNTDRDKVAFLPAVAGLAALGYGAYKGIKALFSQPESTDVLVKKLVDAAIKSGQGKIPNKYRTYFEKYINDFIQRGFAEKDQELQKEADDKGISVEEVTVSVSDPATQPQQKQQEQQKGQPTGAVTQQQLDQTLESNEVYLNDEEKQKVLADATTLTTGKMPDGTPLTSNPQGIDAQRALDTVLLPIIKQKKQQQAKDKANPALNNEVPGTFAQGQGVTTPGNNQQPGTGVGMQSNNNVNPDGTPKVSSVEEDRTKEAFISTLLKLYPLIVGVGELIDKFKSSPTPEVAPVKKEVAKGEENSTDTAEKKETDTPEKPEKKDAFVVAIEDYNIRVALDKNAFFGNILNTAKGLLGSGEFGKTVSGLLDKLDGVDKSIAPAIEKYLASKGLSLDTFKKYLSELSESYFYGGLNKKQNKPSQSEGYYPEGMEKELGIPPRPKTDQTGYYPKGMEKELGIKNSYLKINSETYMIKRGSVFYNEIETALKKFAADNQITDVSEIEIEISKKEGTASFKKKTANLSPMMAIATAASQYYTGSSGGTSAIMGIISGLAGSEVGVGNLVGSMLQKGLNKILPKEYQWDSDSLTANMIGGGIGMAIMYLLSSPEVDDTDKNALAIELDKTKNNLLQDPGIEKFVTDTAKRYGTPPEQIISGIWSLADKVGATKKVTVAEIKALLSIP